MAPPTTAWCASGGPVEGQDGAWELLCHREENTGEAAGNDECRCWYWVTYRCRRMECTKIDEDFLGCDPNCFGGDECDETQREIYGEYNSAEVHGGYGMSPPESPSSCDVIEHHLNGYRPVPHFTWSELNDGFSEGNPHSGNGGGWGWIQASLTQGLERLRADRGQQALGSEYGEGIPLSSGYRCPHGNASIPGASSTSWHMTGRAADVSVKSMAGVWNDWDDMTEDEQAEVQEIWKMLDYLTRPGSLNQNMDPLRFNRYPDRHFHGAW